MEGVLKSWRFLTNISLYFENCTRYGHSYNGRRMGTRIRSMEWCYFQWHWTPNPHFKVMPIFDAEYVING